MVKTRINFAKSKQSPKKKVTKPSTSKKIDRKTAELCEKWITQQKKDVFKIPPPPVDTLHSDSSSDEADLIESRMNLYSQVSPTEAKICLACEWAKCSQIIETYADLQLHVKQHLPAVATEGLFTCEWDLCSFETESQQVFRRHVLYHAYMSNLKSLGEQLLLKKEPLPACINDSRRRNTIPKAEHQLICQWEECTYKFELIQDFFDHARGHCIHELELSKEKNRNNFVQCRWLDCAKKFNKRLKMTDHMRTHTGERFVACSNCGSTFNSYAKFYDHFKRQTLNPTFKCSHCFQSYATEELLNNHTYTHINCVKCTMCDMTCPSPTALAQHFRYRHIKERPFECTQCEYCAVTKWDLSKHIRNMHKKDKATYYCDDCDFSTQLFGRMKKHINNMHGEGPNIYSCHCCVREYSSGGTLSRHLIKKHGFQLPSGHRRFTYQQGIDGIYRVQTTRIESLEVSEQIMATPVNDQTKSEPVAYELDEIKTTENGFAITIAASETNKPETQSVILEEDGEMTSNDELISNEIEADSESSDDFKQENTFRGRIRPQNMPEMNDNPPTPKNSEAELAGSDQTELKSIDDFSVMKKYLKKKSSRNKIIITVDEVDAQGKLIRRETRNATEFHL